MTFGDLSGAAGLGKLNQHLATRSYIEGYQPSQKDTETLRLLKTPPNAEFIHVLRWYNHIKSFGDLKQSPGAVTPATKDDNDDVDLFGSDDEEDKEAAKLKEQRLAEYAAKKSKKPALVAKSNVILDVKPWDDETDMKELEKCVRSVQMEGLLWGVSKLMPVGYGIQKLQITTVIEDDKVSVDELIEKIQEHEDFIQSVDIAAFNKI